MDDPNAPKPNIQLNLLDASAWQEVLDAAQLRCEQARKGVAESAIERLKSPTSDAYRSAQEEEAEALRRYRNLLSAYLEFGR